MPLCNHRPLRTGVRRPTILRFDDSPFSTRGGQRDRLSPFGDGTSSGNIMQGGNVLQSQDYLLDGVTPLRDCIVVNGAATVAPDWTTTGAAVFMCHNLVLDGAATTLSASTNCKGLLGFVDGLVALRNGANLHMNKLGKAGAFGDLSPDMLLPETLAKRIATKKLKAYVVKGRGAEGGPAGYGPHGSSYYAGGKPAGPMQTGGGGTGCVSAGSTGKGGCGGPCCGGAGAGGGTYGTTGAGGDYGGPGGYGITADALGSGGAGDPPGGGGSPGEGPGGGLLCLFAHQLSVVTGCVVSVTGANGGLAGWSGGGAGGGCIVIVTSPGGLANSGTIMANAGGGGGGGGVGSVNIFELKG